MFELFLFFLCLPRSAMAVGRAMGARMRSLMARSPSFRVWLPVSWHRHSDTRCLPFCAFSSNNPLTTDSKLGISELFDKFQSTGKATECLALPGLDLSRKVPRSYKSYRYCANGQLARLFQFFRPLNLPFASALLGQLGIAPPSPGKVASANFEFRPSLSLCGKCGKCQGAYNGLVGRMVAQQGFKGLQANKSNRTKNKR